MKRVLVIGGAGFIGHHIVRELLGSSYIVRVLARFESDKTLLDGLDFELHEGNFEHEGVVEAALKDCDYLIHSAAHYPVYSLKPSDDVRRGLKQISTIHNALAKSNVERFLFISSLTAVGRYPDGRPEDENADYPIERDRSAYCRVKRAMQQMVMARTDDFNTVVVAPTAVIGEGDLRASTGRLLVDVAKGRVPFVVSGRVNVVDVHDVARGVIQAMEKGNKGRIYVLGGENTRIMDLISRIAKTAGAKPPSFALPPLTLMPLAHFSELISKMLQREKPLFPEVGIDFVRFGEYLSSEVAKEEIGYETGPVDAAISRGIDWFKRHGYI